jgi:hypothetical protein
MVTELVRIIPSGDVGNVTQETTQEAREVTVELTTTQAKQYLTAEEDPVLAELWDNDDDAVFDTM